MANPHQGDVLLEASGKTYTLKFSIGALAAMEREFGKLHGRPYVGAVQVFAEFTNPASMSLTALRLPRLT
jgi:hypothetical protein